jgi:IclR family KDG regulon transcriptional repressor
VAKTPPKTENVAAVLKVFAVLEALATGRKATLADLAARSMTSKATAHRLLNTMIELGYVEKNEATEQYGLTLRLFSVGAQSVKDRSEVLWAADRVMSKLSRLTGESINLGVIDSTEERVVYVHKYDSNYNLSMKSTLGLKNPLHSTSLGKALLAWRDPREIEERIGRMKFERSAKNTITDPDVLRADLEAARERGFAEEIEESEDGVRCMAVPVFDHLGRTVAAISLAYPIFRFPEDRKTELVDAMISLGREASESLGFDRTASTRGATE